MLARTRTFALHGVDADPGRRRDRHPPRPAGVLARRAARRRGARVARAGPRRDRQLRLRVPAQADHRQPRSGRPAQGRPGLRPGDRRGDPLRLRAGADAAASTAWWLAGELALDGSIRSACRACWRWPRTAPRSRPAPDRRRRRRTPARLGWSRASRSLALGSLADLARAGARRAPAGAAAVRRPAEPPPLPRPRRPARPAGPAARASRWPRPAGTECSSSARRAPASRWPRAGCPRSCRRSVRRGGDRGDEDRQRRRPADRSTGRSPRVRSAPRTTRSRPPGWSAAARRRGPGEITLAHRGVLFLDELGEFARSSLEALRQPLEDGRVTIARARSALTFPASFQIFAAANPCPCGHGTDSERCNCPAGADQRLRARLSGALADRFDLSLRVEQPSAEALGGRSGRDVGQRSPSGCSRLASVRRLGSGRGATNALDDRGRARACTSTSTAARPRRCSPTATAAWA